MDKWTWTHTRVKWDVKLFRTNVRIRELKPGTNDTFTANIPNIFKFIVIDVTERKRIVVNY